MGTGTGRRHILKSGQTLVVDLGQNLAGSPSVTFSSNAEGKLTLTFWGNV